jgi:hypothetical protein
MAKIAEKKEETPEQNTDALSSTIDLGHVKMNYVFRAEMTQKQKDVFVTKATMYLKEIINNL